MILYSAWIFFPRIALLVWTHKCLSLEAKFNPYGESQLKNVLGKLKNGIE